MIVPITVIRRQGMTARLEAGYPHLDLRTYITVIHFDPVRHQLYVVNRALHPLLPILRLQSATNKTNAPKSNSNPIERVGNHIAL